MVRRVTAGKSLSASPNVSTPRSKNAHFTGVHADPHAGDVIAETGVVDAREALHVEAQGQREVVELTGVVDARDRVANR
jgi:hypothetical protein